MAQIANVKCLWDYCNKIMAMAYDYPSIQVINVEYAFGAANKIDDERYDNYQRGTMQTEPDFKSQLTSQNEKIAVDTIFVKKVMDCENNCARSCHSCSGTYYGGCGDSDCTGSCADGCNGCSSQCDGCSNCTGLK
jgi:hypothetical protein